MKAKIIIAVRKLILNFFAMLVFAGFLFSASLFHPQSASAQATCSYVGQCVNNRKCACPPGYDYLSCYYLRRYAPEQLVQSDVECGSAIIGGVEAPYAVSEINSQAGGDIGVIFFISRLINFANIIAGILVMINFVSAGFLYITGAGNTSANEKITEKMTWSILGILIIVSSYTLAAIIGLIFYNDPTFILTPTLTGALDESLN